MSQDGTIIERAGRALIEAVSAPAKVILFGSHARGDEDDRSDFDFLVIEREVDDRFWGDGASQHAPWASLDPGRCRGRQRGACAEVGVGQGHADP
jgi:Nucleotidyltransferase domain